MKALCESNKVIVTETFLVVAWVDRGVTVASLWEGAGS